MRYTIMSKHNLKGKKAKNSKTAKRTKRTKRGQMAKRAKKTKRRANKRKLSRKRKRGGGQCTSKPANPYEKLSHTDIDTLVKLFKGKYTPYKSEEFGDLLQNAEFKPGVTGAKLVKSTEGYQDGMVMDYKAVLTPYDQILELIKEYSVEEQDQLMSKIRTAHINN